MIALPSNVVPFEMPKRPRIKLKEPQPDQRKVCVMPIKALTDPNITDGACRILALLCSYCNRAGLTWVSQQRLADDMKTSRQNITNQLAKLRAHGYVEIVSKGWRGERCNTLRVVFDSTITAEEAIAITSNKEDTRPPSMRETTDPAGQARIASLIKNAFKSTNTEDKTMPKTGQTRLVREMKEVITKAQSKGSKPVDNPAHIGNPPVSNESTPEVSNEGLHRQPIGHCAVSLNSEEQGIKESSSIDSLTDLIRVLGNQKVVELVEQGLTTGQIASGLETLLPLYAAEGIEPSANVLAAGIIQLQADAR